MTKINLNDQIKVKLTDKGVQHYVDHHNGFVPHRPITADEFKARLDDQGYASFQIHSFIAVFAHLMEVTVYISDWMDPNLLICSKA